MRKQPSLPARIEPDAKWFGNTRTIDQKTLEKLRIELKEQVIDSYSFVLNKKKLPMSLIQEDNSLPKINILEYEKFEVSYNQKNFLKIFFSSNPFINHTFFNSFLRTPSAQEPKERNRNFLLCQ